MGVDLPLIDVDRKAGVRTPDRKERPGKKEAQASLETGRAEQVGGAVLGRHKTGRELNPPPGHATKETMNMLKGRDGRVHVDEEKYITL